MESFKEVGIAVAIVSLLSFFFGLSSEPGSFGVVLTIILSSIVVFIIQYQKLDKNNPKYSANDIGMFIFGIVLNTGMVSTFSFFLVFLLSLMFNS